MLLAYVNESYTRDRYSLVALLVSHVQAISLTRTLGEVVAGAGKAYVVSRRRSCMARTCCTATAAGSRW
ncbi:hypothetical protein [Microbispora sp. H11081]|uniref:hypothetical protein n=1 Tax=Microbispora sp. H11081 TaxID=2729107 RepID=UPI0014730A2B|nr:hypothetical protein [Microbispora sp. H11081]